MCSLFLAVDLPTTQIHGGTLAAYYCGSRIVRTRSGLADSGPFRGARTCTERGALACNPATPARRRADATHQQAHGVGLRPPTSPSVVSKGKSTKTNKTRCLSAASDPASPRKHDLGALRAARREPGQARTRVRALLTGGSREGLARRERRAGATRARAGYLWGRGNSRGQYFVRSRQRREVNGGWLKAVYPPVQDPSAQQTTRQQSNPTRHIHATPARTSVES